MSGNPQSSGPQHLRPPLVGSAGHPQSYGPPISMQFRPVAPAQPAQQFIPAASQQFRPVGQSHVGVPSAQSQQPQFSQPVQQLPPRPGQPVQGPPSSQGIPMSYIQQNRPPITPGSMQPQQSSQPLNNHMPGLGGLGMPLSSSYTFATSYGQPQSNINSSSQYQPMSQMHAPAPPVGTQPWLSSGGQSAPLVMPVLQASQQPSVSSDSVPVTNSQANPTQQSSSDWQEHASADGRRYYYNKKSRQSSWEKPLELMTPIEMPFGTSGEKYDCSICM